jgi:3-hydroxyacyl-CoA dehydrogenase
MVARVLTIEGNKSLRDRPSGQRNFSRRVEGDQLICRLLVKYAETGWLGRKTKRGFCDSSKDVPVPTR